MTTPLPRDPALSAALFDTASQLRSDHPTRPLRGKNIALLTPDPERLPARALAAAAVALGASVVPIRLGSLPPAGTPTFPETLALLGRLYDGVLTDGVPAPLVQEVATRIDRPLLDGAVDTARALAPDDADFDSLLQAVVLQALA